MGVTVKITHNADIGELIGRNKEFGFLRSFDVPAKEMYRWDYFGTPSRAIQAIVIGKSGYGKSTTLNRIVGKEVFETSDVEACTKEMYSAEYHLSKPNQYFSLCDLPGVGESLAADKQYYEWYNTLLQKASMVLYILRADQRDFSVDLNVYNELIKKTNREKQILFAINCADKIEPIGRTTELSDVQKINLERKIGDVKRIFRTENVIAYSAETGYNFDALVTKIACMVRSECR